MARTLSTEEFKRRAVEVHGDKFGYDKVHYVHCRTEVLIYCKKCKKYFEQTPHSHAHSGAGCPYCKVIARTDTRESFIKKAIAKHGDIHGYDKVVYINNRTKVLICCKKCKKYFEQTPSAHLQGNGCPHCRLSKGEKQIASLLDKLHVVFEAQKKFPDCKNKYPLPFDFYLPDYNLCIEFQGEQHYDPHFFIVVRGQEKGAKRFKRLQENDKIKRQFCVDNGVELLEIRYDEDLEKKLTEKLKEYTSDEKVRENSF